MESLDWLGVYLLYFILILVLTRKMVQWYIRNNWFAQNYHGKSILLGFGLGIVVHYLIFFILSAMLPISDQVMFHDTASPYRALVLEDMLLFMILLSVLCLIGWIDDHFGETEVKGLSGHFYALFHEYKVTSGMLKAVYGLFLSLFLASFYYHLILEWLIASSLLLLSIHFFNLLDVRPGRAIKGFWFSLLFIVPFLSLSAITNFVIPIVVSTTILFQYDRRRVVMLGDTGSNVLGGIYGFLLITHVPTLIQACYLFSLVILTLIAEKYSFSAIIQKNPWLSKLDNWGIR